MCAAGEVWCNGVKHFHGPPHLRVLISGCWHHAALLGCHSKPQRGLKSRLLIHCVQGLMEGGEMCEKQTCGANKKLLLLLLLLMVHGLVVITFGASSSSARQPMKGSYH